MILRVVGHGLELIVAAVFQCRTDDGTRILLSLAVEREHHLGMVGMRIAYAIIVADNELAWLQLLVAQLSLGSPCTREVAHPYIATADRKHGRSEGGQGNDALFAVADFGPRLNHIHILVGTILQVHLYIIYRILEMDGGKGGICLLLHVAARSHESRREITVAMAHSECSLCRSVQSIGWISIHSSVGSHLQILQVGSIQLGSEVEILSRFAVLHIEDERDALTVN